MQKRTLKVALLAVLTICLVLGMTTVALADQTWSDLPDTVTAKYGITDNQVAAISDGYPGGLWKPYQSITREQFTKLAVAAFNIPLVDAATPSFTDVPKSSIYYAYIEGAKAAGVINGTTATTFSPKALITRQQAVAIIARWVALKAGYDLSSLSADWINTRLAHFGDAASVSADLKDEMAFAIEMGITQGNDYGNLAPLANLTRIQAAAMLIRAQALVPPAQWTAAKVELVSADRAENLIGKVQHVTFKVTDASGHPAAGVLVDFSNMMGGTFQVGNISPEAAVTNCDGLVTVDLISDEPGTQRVAATVNGVGTVYATAYWLVLDEVYILDEDLQAENNAGESHQWQARVVVFGPGPRSTSPADWYNAVDASYDPSNVNVGDGIDVICDEAPGGLSTDDSEWDYNFELALAGVGYYPRTLAGINVEWAIVNVVDDNPVTPQDETVPSVGNITKVDGAAITPAKSAVGVTDGNGLSSIVIESTQTGQTKVVAVADYAGNPYPQQLFNHSTSSDYEDHYYDWDDQPVAPAIAVKTWIPHVIGGDSNAPITPAYAVNNTGEVETYTLTLKDVYGNPIPGYTVMWWLQGVGEFKTTGASWSGIGEQNKQWDITDANGQAKVWVKSLVPGQTIIHCKVMDKYGLPYKEWNVVKQWYSIDDVFFTNKDADANREGIQPPQNVVNTGHTFTVKVSGAKYIHTLYDLNGNGLSDDEVLVGNRDDIKAASGYVAVMQGNVLDWVGKAAGEDILPGQVFSKAEGQGPYYTRLADTQLTGAEYWADKNGDNIREIWSGLAGKTVYFFNNVGKGGTPLSDTPIPTYVPGDDMPWYVGSITSATQAVTDAQGLASVSINSTVKGYQWVYAVADYTDNPQDGDPFKPTQWHELRWDVAKKIWLPDTSSTVIKVFEQSGKDAIEGIRWTNPVLPYGEGEENPNVANIAVQVFDQYGNALEGYKVTWEVLGQGTTTAGTVPTYHPYAHLEDPAHDNPLGSGAAGTGDRNPHVDANWIHEGDDNDVAGDADDDWAWGWTLDHQINFKLDTASAANVNLVLDETREDLADYDHVTSIVNIRVYSPTGALVAQYEVTKVWVTEYEPIPTSIVIEGREAITPGDWGSGPWVFDISEGQTAVDIRGKVLDQYGQVIDPDDVLNDYNVKVRVTSNYTPYNVIYGESDLTSDGSTYLYGQITGIVQPNVATLQVWLDDGPGDESNNNKIDAGELASNVLSAEFVQ